MLNEIEQAALQRITDKLAAIRKAGGKKGGEIVGPSPSVDAGCLEGGFERVAGKWKQTVTLSLLLTFASPKSEEARRKGANPLVEGIVLYMLEQKLGLGITALQPLRWREVTNEDDYTEGKIKYLIQFSTSFTIEKLDEEEVEDLLGVAAEYLLKPGDDRIDAADENPVEAP